MVSTSTVTVVQFSSSASQERESGYLPNTEGARYANRGTLASHLAIVRHQYQ